MIWLRMQRKIVITKSDFDSEEEDSNDIFDKIAKY